MKNQIKEKLTFEKLLTFVNEWDAVFRRRYPATKNHRTLVHVAKLTEEMGELANAILASMGRQRTTKLKTFKRGHVDGEMADVIITVLVLADTLGIDIRNPLTKKMAKIKRRAKNW